jgi:hypothetical protein
MGFASPVRSLKAALAPRPTGVRGFSSFWPRASYQPPALLSGLRRDTQRRAPEFRGVAITAAFQARDAAMLPASGWRAFAGSDVQH